jgi:flavin-dependent dehydrogenase
MDADWHPAPRLLPHSRIAIIGGGPAGSFFALHALQLAGRLALPLDITLFERKDFTAAGPHGCNMCAGILSRRTLEGLAALGLSVPPPVIMGRIRAYHFHWGATAVSIHPSEPSREVLSVYRGGGPRKSPYEPTPGLDDFLLKQAQARGARIIAERVEEILFRPHPRVCTSSREETFDLIVLASGVNASLPAFRELDYTPPATELLAQNELQLGPPGSSAMDGAVHIYFERPRGLTFGALVPKGPFAGVSVLGNALTRDSMEEFLEVPEVAQVLGADRLRACSCHPRVAVTTARGFFADRFVAVGDACVSRLYKDGIGSALATARVAAETALRHGIGRKAFAAHYAPACRSIARDNVVGRVVFGLIHYSKRNAWFMRALADGLRAEANEASGAPVVSPILWALFTGDTSYAQILRSMFRPRAILRIGRAMIHELWRRAMIRRVGKR